MLSTRRGLRRFCQTLAPSQIELARVAVGRVEQSSPGRPLPLAGFEVITVGRF
jgi:hypothetical protein